MLLTILIVALGAATFIENDFGAEIARRQVYNSKWFELILLLLSFNFIARIIVLKLYKAQKFSIFLFHFAFLVMILGAGITRYFGYEGTMHIREGKSSSTIETRQKVLSVFVDNTTYNFNADLETKQKFEGEIEEHQINIVLSKIYESAIQEAVETPNGNPVIGFVLAGPDYRGFEHLRSNENKLLGNLSIAFNSTTPADISLFTMNDSIFLDTKYQVYSSVMGGEATPLNNAKKIAVETRRIYSINGYNFVLQQFLQSAQLVTLPSTKKNEMMGHGAMIFTLNDGNNSTKLTWWANGENKTRWTKLGDKHVGIRYSFNNLELPFSIYLKDFVIDRYPGSMSPSSFSSYVTLNEEGQEPVPFHIYMNNILKHKGFRFYQSSYDQDERGTILSVNHDFWGTFISYLGYFLMTLGMIWSMMNRNSFFRKTILRTPKTIVALIVLSIGLNFAVNKANAQLPTDYVPIDETHSEQFGKLFIQNNKGRTEPIYTFSSELMRKIARDENMYKLSPVQIFIDMNINPQIWANIPLIRVTNKELQEQLGITSKYAAYTDFISNNHGYVLQQQIQKSFAKAPAERSKYDKAIIKTDEKVNICYAIFTGEYLKILPLPNKTEDSKWYNSIEASTHAGSTKDSVFLANLIPTYFNALNQGKQSGSFKSANDVLIGIAKYQKETAQYNLPSKFKTDVEVSYYKQNPFKRLFPFYTGLGVTFLFILIGIIITGRQVPRALSWVFYAIILCGYILHTLGIAARWYISGHAPMSNGYESMIFISWVTLSAGFLFHKRSPFAIPATAALGGLTLMVANLSFMDPQITNLVPVLQSYWLTIHVSVITASYGFLGLGALLGIINLILISLNNSKNKDRILETLESLSVINHKTLIAGLYLLTIGTFLGAVWANESWGRYWGWDPKETWALISILVYTLVTHARLIPGMKGIFAFNALSLFGFSSILMTYFGVNYYLSGLHSYAGGDPVPIPSFVYYSVAAAILLTLFASIKYKTLYLAEKDH